MGKKVLITAGSTWVKIDQVRILTNRFSGKTGLYLAKGLKKKGHQVTFLANPHCLGKIGNIKTYTYYYFEEFKSRVEKLLEQKTYDAIVHMTAVSDYKIKNAYTGKIPSGKQNMTLELKPAEKIIKKIRVLAEKSLLIQFKLESKRKGIVDKAYKSLIKNKSDFVVANALEDLKTGYKAQLIDKDKNIMPIGSKAHLLKVVNSLVTGKY